MDKVVRQISTFFNHIGFGFLLVMMFLVSADVVGRYFFNKPIKGTMEIVELLLGAMIFLALAYTGRVGGHIRIELLVSRFSPKMQAIMEAVGIFLGITAFSLIGWRGATSALHSMVVGEVTDALHIPFFPNRWIIAIGCFCFCLVLLVQFLQLIPRIRSSRVKR